MSSSSKNFQSSNKPGSEKKYQGTLVASPAKAISPKSMKYILPAKQLILSGESTGHVASFLVKVVALEVDSTMGTTKICRARHSARLEALLFEAKGEWVEAERAYAFILENNPFDQIVHKRKFAIAKARGDMSLAVDYLKKYLELFMADHDAGDREAVAAAPGGGGISQAVSPAMAADAHSIIPGAMLRNLSDKLYEKRKNAALEESGISKFATLQ